MPRAEFTWGGGMENQTCTSLGTFTDDKGNFKLTGNLKLPATLIFSSIGYANKEVIVVFPIDSVYLIFKVVSSNCKIVEVNVSPDSVCVKISPTLV